MAIKRPLFNIKELLEPGDSIPFFAMLLGLTIAIALPEIPIKLIGGSILILGSVPLVMRISQRLKKIMETKGHPGVTPPDLTIVEMSGQGARRSIFEGFTEKFGADDENDEYEEDAFVHRSDKPKENVSDQTIVHQESTSENIKPEAVHFDSGEEGFKVISKTETPTQILNMPITIVSKSEVVSIPEIIKSDIIESENIESEIIKPEIPEPEIIELEPIVSLEPEISISESIEPEVTHIDETTTPTIEKIEEKPIEENKIISTEIPTENQIIEPIDELIFEEEESEIKIIGKIITPKSEIPQKSETKIESKNKIESKPVIEPTLPKTPELIITPVETKQEPEKKSAFREKKLDIPATWLMESEELTGQEPRKEFQYFLSRVLMVIKSVVSTRSVSFILGNIESDELIVEHIISDVGESLIPSRRFRMGRDILSQIISSGKPEILTDIESSAISDLIPYYSNPVEISSFIGVPVFYKRSVIGILCCDSPLPEAYDAVTVGFFGQFTRLIGAIMMSYTEKYDLKQSYRTLEAIETFRNIMSQNSTNLDDAAVSVVEAAAKLLDFATVGITIYDENTNNWVIKAIHTKDESSLALLDAPVDLDNSLISQSINFAKTVFVSPVDRNILRITQAEKQLSEGGYFVSVPLKSMQHNFGALYVEGRNRSAITQPDIEILETLGDHAGTAFEQLYFNKMLNTTAIRDADSGLLNHVAFGHRLEEEYARARDFKTLTVLCLMQIDKYDSYDPILHRERLESVYSHVLSITRKYLHVYDVFAKIEEGQFGIIIQGKNLEEARLWAERLRSEIAITVLEIKQQRFTVTVSLGLASAQKALNKDQFFNNSMKALEISSKKTNSTMVFS